MKGTCLVFLFLSWLVVVKGLIGLGGFTRLQREENGARFTRVTRNPPVYRILMGGVSPQFEKRANTERLFHLSPKAEQKRDDPEPVLIMVP